MKALLNWFKTLVGRAPAPVPQAQPQPRVVPVEYLERCYRRLADNAQQIEDNKGKCFSCRHSIGYVTWWCERISKKGLPCEWAPCYNREEISPRDLKAGERLVGGWLPLPPEEQDRTKVEFIPITQDLTETRVKK